MLYFSDFVFSSVIIVRFSLVFLVFLGGVFNKRLFWSVFNGAEISRYFVNYSVLVGRERGEDGG